MRTQLANSFDRAGERAGIPFKVTPHVLRTSLITLFAVTRVFRLRDSEGYWARKR